jgi:transposase
MNILNLPHWTVLSSDKSEHDYRLTVQYDIHELMCPNCLSMKISRFGKLSQLFMDLPAHAKRVGLNVQRQRYRCDKCSKTFMQELPDMDEKRAVTKRLLKYIQQESLRRTFTSVAEDVGLTEKTIRNIFKAHVADLAKTVVFATPEWLGIDELYLLKKPRCIITNVKERTVVDLLVNRNKPVVRNCLKGMADKQHIQLVTMDMWQPYKEAVKDVIPHAQIIVDKYHIVRMANQSMESVRKVIRAGLTDRQRRTLMHDRHILLRRRFELKPSDTMILQSWTGTFPALGTSYDLKERFMDIWLSATRPTAESAYRTWRESIPDELEAAFKPLTLAVDNWHTEIFAYFNHGSATNAYTEALNGLVKLTNKTGRGYSFDAIRAKLLYGIGLHKQQKPPYQKDWPSDRLGYDFPPVDEPTATNYGNDISTLIEELSHEEDE